MNDTITDEQRWALINDGLRTLAFEFNGSGDSGSIGELLVVTDPSVGLDPDEGGTPDYVPRWDSKSKAHYKKYQQIIEKHKAYNALETLAYAALERHFDGDWVNNEGGYGQVYLDLLTGVCIVDGYQRITTEEPCGGGGPVIDALEQELDVVKSIKQTLKV